MNICENCKNELSEGAAFCKHCGAKAPERPDGEAAFQNVGYCKICGEKLLPGTAVCPKCGAELQPVGEILTKPEAISYQTAPMGGPVRSPLKKQRLIIIVVAAVLFLGMCVGAVSIWSALAKSPAEKLKMCVEYVIKDGLVKNLVNAVEGYNSNTRLSTDMLLTASSGGDVSGYLKDSSLGIKLDTDGKSVLANLDLKLMGSSVLDGILTYDKGILGFSLPSADPAYYTIDVDKLMQESLNEYNNGSLDGFSLKDINFAEIDAKAVEKIANEYVEIFVSMITEENVTAIKGDSFYLERIGQSFKGEQYVFAPKPKDIEETYKRLADKIEGDEELRNIIKKSFMANAASKDSGFEKNINDEVDKAFMQGAAELRNAAEQAGALPVDNENMITLGINGTRVHSAHIESKINATAIFYESFGEGKGGRVDKFYSVQGDETLFMISCDTAETEEGREGSVNMEFEDEVTIDVSFEKLTDKKSILGFGYGNYKVEVRDGYTQALISASVKAAEGGGTDHLVRIEGTEDFGAGSSVELNLFTTDKKSTAEKPSADPTDITDYKDEELYALFEKYGSAVGNDFEGAMR